MPLVAVALIVTCISVLCCYWAHLAASNVQKEVAKKNRYDVELDFYGAKKEEEEEEDSDDDDDEESSEDESDEEGHRPKMVRKGASAKSSDGKPTSAVPEVKVNGIVETPKANGHVLNKSTSLPNGSASVVGNGSDSGNGNVGGRATPIMDRLGENIDQRKGAGYQVPGTTFFFFLVGKNS